MRGPAEISGRLPVLDVPYYALVNTDKEHDVGWVAREECKAGHVPDGETLLVVQASPAWADTHYDDPPAENVAELARHGLLPRQLRVLDVGAGVGGPALGLADLLPDDNWRETYLIQKGDTMRAPREGEIFRNPDLANTLEMIAEGGEAGERWEQLDSDTVEISERRAGRISTATVKQGFLGSYRMRLEPYGRTIRVRLAE